MTDILSRVDISTDVMDRLIDLAASEARCNPGVKIAETPNDETRLESDGSLTLYVNFTHGKSVCLRIEPEEWQWKPGMK